MEKQKKTPGRKKLNRRYYNRYVHPDFFAKLDKYLKQLKAENPE
jgi:hypothetical protein